MPEFEIGTHFCVLLEKNIPQNAQELCVLPTDKVKIKWFLILHELHKHAKNWENDWGNMHTESREIAIIGYFQTQNKENKV